MAARERACLHGTQEPAYADNDDLVTLSHRLLPHSGLQTLPVGWVPGMGLIPRRERA